MIDRETTSVFKTQVENEYFTRSIYEDLLIGTIEQQIVETYEDEVVTENLASDFIDQEIVSLCEKTHQKECETNQIANFVHSQIVDTLVRGMQLDVVLDLFLEDFLQEFAQTTVSHHMLDQELLVRDLYGDMVSSLIKKEVGFTLQLERDAESIF